MQFSLSKAGGVYYTFNATSGLFELKRWFSSSVV